MTFIHSGEHCSNWCQGLFLLSAASSALNLWNVSLWDNIFIKLFHLSPKWILYLIEKSLSCSFLILLQSWNHLWFLVNICFDVVAGVHLSRGYQHQSKCSDPVQSRSFRPGRAGPARRHQVPVLSDPNDHGVPLFRGGRGGQLIELLTYRKSSLSSDMTVEFVAVLGFYSSKT